jgi:hypothetical protein
VVAVLLAFIVYSFVDVMGRSPHRQQGHAEVTDAIDHAMQRRLINHRSHQHRRAIRLTLHGQLPEPLRPVVLKMSLHTHFIDVGHGTSATPPSVIGALTLYEPWVSLEITRKV